MYVLYTVGAFSTDPIPCGVVSSVPGKSVGRKTFRYEVIMFSFRGGGWEQVEARDGGRDMGEVRSWSQWI